MIKAIISGLIAGIVDILFYLNDLQVFSEISYYIVKIPSIGIGIMLHLIASIVVFLVAILILKIANLKQTNLVGAPVLGILLGTAVLSLFSLPVHLLIFPINITLTYDFSHVVYGVIAYLVYYTLGRENN